MKILLSGGGTGGHIYPALAFMNYVKSIQPQAEFLYVGTSKGLEANIVPKAGVAFQTVEIQGLKRSLSLDNFKTLYLMVKSLGQAKKILKDFQPDVVIGTGGFVCAPVLRAATKLGIPTIIHEQNSLAGVTNRYLAPKVSAIAICFPQVAKDFAKYQEKVHLTGNPRGQEIASLEKNEDFFSAQGLDPQKATVCIFGGSRGAPKINQSFLQALPQLAGKDYQVAMITGQVHYPAMKEQVDALGGQATNIHLFPYMQDMPQFLQGVDLVVGRAGATSLTELTALGIASILIPSPYVTANHQVANAQSLVDSGAARMILEKDLDGSLLIKEIDQVMTNQEKLTTMRKAAYQMGVRDASSRLYQVMQEVCGD